MEMNDVAKKIIFVADAPLLKGNSDFLKRIFNYEIDKSKFDCLLSELRKLEKQAIFSIANIVNPKFKVEYLDVTENESIQFKYTNKTIEALKEDANCVIVLDRDMLDIDKISKAGLEEKINFLDITRTSNGDLVNRFGYNNLQLQIQNIANYIIENKKSKITFVDDVLFSGNTILSIKKGLTPLLKEYSKNKVISYNAIFALSIYEELGAGKLSKSDISVSIIAEQKGAKDLVDARDICFGFKNSGRTTENGNKSYFLPFGDPSWASIPSENYEEYSAICIDYSRRFWTEIGKVRGSGVLLSEFKDNGIAPMPYIPDNEININISSVVDILEQAHLCLSSEEKFNQKKSINFME